MCRYHLHFRFSARSLFSQTANMLVRERLTVSSRRPSAYAVRGMRRWARGADLSSESRAAPVTSAPPESSADGEACVSTDYFDVSGA